MNMAVRAAALVLAVSASSAAFAEAVLDTSTPAKWRASLTQMAVECDGEPRGPCFSRLLTANGKIEQSYFGRFMKGVSGSSPAHKTRYEEMVAVRNKELDGITRAELLRRADALE